MKTAHIADLHHCPERHTKVIKILDELKKIAPGVDLITNSGENFNNPYSFTEKSGYNELLDKWEEITNITPVATIRATQGKHERPGMVETLQRAGVVILEPGSMYCLHGNNIVKHGEGITPSLILFGVPHPHKANVMAKEKVSRDEGNAIVNQKMRGLYAQYGAMRAQFPDVPALAVGHGVVKGKNTRDIKAMESSDIYSTEADLALMNCGFCAWGHYHNPVEFETIRGGYLGAWAWDFNELEYKPAITIVDWDTMTVIKHYVDINMKKKLVIFPGDEIPDLMGYDVHLVNNQTEWTEADCKDKGAGLVKVTTEIEKEHKVRSKAVMEAVTYSEKFLAVYPEATQEQLLICDEFWKADIALGKIPEKKVITPLYCEIYGSKIFMERMGKETIRIDFEDLQDGLNMLTGPGGQGKSTLMDYISPFSVLFLQPNALLSTFELGDSHIKQGFMVNDTVYHIEKYFKPTLKNPTAEYYAFEGDARIPLNESGNRKPYDEWCVGMFGSARKYSTSVLNTQFDDNDGSFMGQPINPSLFKATNIELKSLFHELAGTDLKHLELKCKTKMDSYEKQMTDEEGKKAGVEESIPNPEVLEAQIINFKSNKDARETILRSSGEKVKMCQKDVDHNKEKEIKKTSLQEQIATETQKKIELEASLSQIENLDIEAANRDLISKEAEKSAYEQKLKDLPGITEANRVAREKYAKDLQDWNDSVVKINQLNGKIQAEIQAQNSITREVGLLESQKTTRIQQITSKIQRDNQDAQNAYTRTKSDLEGAIATLNTRTVEGQNLIDSIKTCPECGYVDPDAESQKARYIVKRDDIVAEKVGKEALLAALVVPVNKLVECDVSQEDAAIEALKSKIKLTEKTEPLPPKPEDVKCRDEVVPTFNIDAYNSLKEKIASFATNDSSDIQTKISEIQKRILNMQSKINLLVIDPVAQSVLEEAMRIKDNDVVEIGKLSTSIAVAENQLLNIEEQRKSLIKYDERIKELRNHAEFWKDMKLKWGPNGVPARILEFTGPYVDELANNILAKYYPIFKVHSETTKPSSDGKKELEIFTISAINQETGRGRPLNAISGEERHFIQGALREAFRKVDKQNSLIEWLALFEDEPDAHVSSDYSMAIWDMIEEMSEGKKALCVCHSPEVKHRSAVSIDIRSLG